MQSRNRKLTTGLALVIALLAAAPGAAAQPSAAIQYSSAPLPAAADPRSAAGYPRERLRALPPEVRRSLTGAAGKQLRVVATSRELGAPAGISDTAATGESSWASGTLALVILLAVLTAVLLFAFARTRRGAAEQGSWKDLASRLAVLAVGLAAAATLIFSGPREAPAAKVPSRFFGIAPQTILKLNETSRMKRAGIGSIRAPVPWSLVQPTAAGPFNWAHLDQVVTVSAKRGIRVLPFLYSTPSWVSPRSTNLPIDTAEQRTAWVAFVRAAVDRYGPTGTFWGEHGPGSPDPVPKVPIRDWQLWNEANFFYFTTPASPRRYARLLKLTSPEIRAADPGATIVLSGLFGNPKERPPRAMSAATFLTKLYRVGDVKRHFDAAALHPYARNVRELRLLTDRFRRVMIRFGDRRGRLWITEMGWGSGRDTIFEKGLRGQARQLRGAYDYLISNRRRLGVQRTYWFSWKDKRGSCNFCDSVGLFRRGSTLKPKPAWFSLVRIAGGRP